ncbi:MAG: type 2 lanthipeptide synthetase LanM family protein, partial [Cyanobacteriota bacterium]|nr:type 2 lanthipeptide synthetase LanM family protein [Cyanobacteriota bacterium]
MNPVNLRESQWYQALPLEERIQLLGRIDEQEVDRARCDRKMQRWLSQNPFTNSTCYDKRLAVEGVTKQQFCDLLGESPESLARRCSHPPHWLSTLHRAFSQSDFAKIAIAPVENLPDERVALGFLQLVKPLLNDAIARLETGVQKLSQNYPNLPFIPEKIKQVVLANLPDRLLGMISQTMVLELNVARLKGQLSGETAKERLLNFIQGLENPQKAVSLLQEYPVLARQLAIHIHQWVEVNLEFLERLCRDWSEICRCFGLGDNSENLIKIQPGAGDSHRGGKSVFILHFSSGFKLVYKPKPLAIDQHLQDLLAWLNEQTHHPPFPLLKILNRGGYGWVEFIPAASCATTEEVERFYERIGGYLALMYALEATDFHLENLIAAGENPVLIDLETLFRPERIDPHSPEAMLIANWDIGQSVMGVGLLPQRTVAKGKSAGLDLSGMGAVGDQILPNPTPQLLGNGTDEMRVDRRNSLLGNSQNRPYLNGEEVKVWTYQNFIEKGFTNIYRLLMQHREELLSSWISQFAEDEIRVVLRDTRLYGLLLQESFHPDVLRDALERDRLFDRLWVDIPNRPYLARAIPLEKKALWRGDVPLFSTHPASRDLFGEGEKIADFFARSGMERVRDRLLRLSETDLEKQLWFIRTSLTSLAMTSREEKRTGQAQYCLVEPERMDNLQSLSERSLKITHRIALRLDSLALREQNRASWIGLGLVGEGYWSIKPLAWDLFEGLPGIALFLGYLGTVLQDNRYERLAKDVLNTIL